MRGEKKRKTFPFNRRTKEGKEEKIDAAKIKKGGSERKLEKKIRQAHEHRPHVTV